LTSKKYAKTKQLRIKSKSKQATKKNAGRTIKKTAQNLKTHNEACSCTEVRI